MFCEAYKQSLTDVAAQGEVLPSALKQHLASCESCRVAFAEEQSLLVAIDSGVRAAANSEVPLTLIPLIRVALNNEPPPQPWSVCFSVWRFAGATVTAAAVLALLYLPFRHPSTSVEPTRTALAPGVAPSAPAAAATVNSPGPRGVSVLQHSSRTALAQMHTSATKFPEVVVAPDERAGLLRYEEFLRRRPAAIQIASTRSLAVPRGIEPLEIAEIELGEPRILPLTKSDSDGDTTK